MYDGEEIRHVFTTGSGHVTGGRVRVTGCGQERLVTAIPTLWRMGERFEIDEEGSRPREWSFTRSPCTPARTLGS
jgi:hypothetical protein